MKKHSRKRLSNIYSTPQSGDIYESLDSYAIPNDSYTGLEGIDTAYNSLSPAVNQPAVYTHLQPTNVASSTPASAVYQAKPTAAPPPDSEYAYITPDAPSYTVQDGAQDTNYGETENEHPYLDVLSGEQKYQ